MILKLSEEDHETAALYSMRSSRELRLGYAITHLGRMADR